MLRIVALNEEENFKTNTEEEVYTSKEVQGAIAESEYLRAITMKSKGKLELSLALFEELLETKILNDDLPQDNRSDKLWAIRYNCHKNIANIYEELHYYDMALQHYKLSMELDNSDVYTMNRLGRLALKSNALELAEYAFENCIRRNPAHLKAAEGLLQTLCSRQNVMGAYGWALTLHQRDATYQPAIKVLSEVAKHFKVCMPLFHKMWPASLYIKELTATVDVGENEFALFTSKNIVKEEAEEDNLISSPDLSQYRVKTLNWLSLAQFIINVQQYCKTSNTTIFLTLHYEDLTANLHDRLQQVKASADSDKAENKNSTEVETNYQRAQNTFKVSSQTTETEASTQCDEENGNFVLPNTAVDSILVNSNEEMEIQQQKADASDAKPKPRRRCSDLHLLEQWGWHKNRRYSRKKTQPERTEVDTSLNGFLRRTFAKFTEQTFEDTWPFSSPSADDTYAGWDDAVSCNVCTKISTVEEFQKETEEIFNIFQHKLKGSPFDLVLLIYRWLKYISMLWSKRLPKEICTIYLDIFNLYLEYFDFSTWNQLTTHNYEASYRFCQLYLELKYDKMFVDDSEVKLWKMVYDHLLFNSGRAFVTFEQNFDIYKMRLVNADYLWHNYSNKKEKCLTCLDYLEQLLTEQSNDFVLHLPNLNNTCLTKRIVNNMRMELERKLTLKKVPLLYEEDKWTELAAIIKNNIKHSKDNENENWTKDFKMQMQLLLQSLFNQGVYEDCLFWAEKSFHYTICRYLKQLRNSTQQKLWAETVNFILSYIESLILNEGFDIVEQLEANNSRLVQNLIRLLSYHLDAPYEKNNNSIPEIYPKQPWVILHQIALREESQAPVSIKTKSIESEEEEELVPNSFLLLFTAHEFLGKRQWCIRDNGVFLRYILDTVAPNLRAPLYDGCRDAVYEYIEQVTYCLYGYPQKKPRSRHLEDHEATPVDITWPNAIQLFDLYRPECLPEINSYKLESISADMEQLLTKILTLMPIELNPTVNTAQITAFIEGKCKIAPSSESLHTELPYKISSIYYLLGDYYFKNRDFCRTIKYYTLDLTINPGRFDSWAGMALSKASKIETKLNSISPIDLNELLAECEETLRCFEQCISINKHQILLWIEYGSFAYTMHAFLSRYSKKIVRKSSAQLTPTFEAEKKQNMLNIAYNCFSLATTLQNAPVEQSDETTDDTHDEKWLCQFMLGKISEKRHEQPKTYLNYYLTAANCLYECNATYPIKINHSNPTTLSVEALEVFYRINAAILKYVQLNKTIERATGVLFNEVLTNLSQSPFAYNKAKIDGNSLNALKRKSTQSAEQSTIPIKINKPELYQNSATTVEAMKVLENNKGKIEMANTFNSVVEAVKEETNMEPNTKYESVSNATSPLRRESQESAATGTTTTVTSSTTSSSSSDSSSSSSDSDSDSQDACPENDDKKTDNLSYNNNELRDIYKIVVRNLEECVTRFPEHYKSIYRLVYHYLNGPTQLRDLKRCEELLLGQYKTSLENQINGLFYDRKNNNFFNGIWRIPSSEIDRPGSFSAHLIKCVNIFLEFLLRSENHKLLIDVGLALFRTPDQDKRYIPDNGRLELYQQSINYCAQILRNILQKNIKKRDDVELLNLLLDVYKAYKKYIKHINHKEQLFTQLMIDVYKYFILDKVERLPDNLNFLDLAIKLCLQEISLRKNLGRANTAVPSMLEDTALGLHTFAISVNTSTKIPRPLQIPGLPGVPPRNRARYTAKALSALENTGLINFPTTSFGMDSMQAAAPFLTTMAQFGTTTTTPQDTLAFQNLVSEYYNKLMAEGKAKLGTSGSTALPGNYAAIALPLETTITPANLQAIPTTAVSLPDLNKDKFIATPTSLANSDITITPCDWKPFGNMTASSAIEAPQKILTTYVAPPLKQSKVETSLFPSSLQGIFPDVSIIKQPLPASEKSNSKTQLKTKSGTKSKQSTAKPYSRPMHNTDYSNMNIFDVSGYNQHISLMTSYADLLNSNNLEPNNLLSQDTAAIFKGATSAPTNQTAATASLSVNATPSQTQSQLPVSAVKHPSAQSPFGFSSFDGITMTPLPVMSHKANSNISSATSVLPKPGVSIATQQLLPAPTYSVQMSPKTLQQKLAERQKANQLNEIKSANIITPASGNVSANQPNVDVIILD